MQVVFINENPVLQMGSHCVDDTLSMVMVVPAVSDNNAGRIH